jgi:hypothetical protein
MSVTPSELRCNRSGGGSVQHQTGERPHENPADCWHEGPAQPIKAADSLGITGVNSMGRPRRPQTPGNGR